MGATNIQQVLIGKDLRDAFATAQRAGLYECGHDPYNGTISTATSIHEIEVDFGRVSVEKFCKAVWDASFEDSQLDSFKVIKRSLPSRLWAKAGHASDIVRDSKWGTWLAVKLPYRDAKIVRERAGLKGKQVQVWMALGWAAE